MELAGLTSLINNVALLALLAAPPSAPTELRAAILGPDADAVARVGQRTSADDLEAALAHSERIVRRAAARAAPHCADAWVLLLPLATLAREPDHAEAAEAARAAAAIARDLDRARVLAEEIPDDRVRARLHAWRAATADTGLWPDVRVLAMEVSAILAAALGADAAADDVAYDLAARLEDPEPEVRRAALELLPTDADALPAAAVGERLRRDEDPTVALVAGQILCAGIAVGDPPARALDAAGQPGIEKLRRLVLRPNAPPNAALGAARCLAADGAPESRTALERLAARGPRSIRRRVRALLRKGQ
jgi:hypothetical protein